ncbi:hypothetical protein [Proteiniphilum sp. UBA5463]|mgnify:CR=1 FL=1|jgi:hypothetical protein|uniref:hypothetical protein n=1 Tax=Proteiniphilum sp. UBA5463 TaxID=1947281 RepID=UPI002579ABF3|nr:hypothetical protein [Proteiniphilum sp. UBA5463]
MKTKEIITGYPFVDHVDQDSRPELSIDFLDRAYTRFYTNNQNIINFGYYKLMGYKYDFKPYLKKYLYKQYGSWREAYAPNKTKLRGVVFGKIDRIIELKDK